MKTAICKKLAAITMAGAITASLFLPRMQIMAAQQIPMTGRTPVKAVQMFGEIYNLPDQAILYYDTAISVDPWSGDMLIMSAYDDQNHEVSRLHFGFEYGELSLYQDYNAQTGNGTADSCALHLLDWGDMNNHSADVYMYGPDGRAYLTEQSAQGVSYQYDAEGKVISCVESEYLQYRYEYNKFGKISTVYTKYLDDNDFQPEKILTYDKQGRFVKLEYCYNNLEGMEKETVAEITYDTYGNPLSLKMYFDGWCEEVTMIY